MTDSMRGELRAMLRLAWPVILAELGWVLMGIVDTIVVGGLGPAAIAAVGIGSTIFFAFMVLGLGTFYALDTFVLMGEGRNAHYQDRISMIEVELAQELRSDAPLAPPRGGRLSRRVRHFPISPAVDIRPDERGAFHVLSVVAADRPGLLYGVARILARYRINLQTARINTLGDRAEDVFLVSSETLKDAKTVLQLEQDLLKELSLQAPAPVLETALR